MKITMPMMKCGCIAMTTCSGRGDVKYDPPIPSCIVHDCFEVADTPDLTGRIAKCHCGATRQSGDLPFFEYHGPGSREASERCKCGYFEQAHWPLWRAHIKVVRRWFAHERYESVERRDFHAPATYSNEGAEAQAEFWREQTHDEKTKVFSAEVIKVEPRASPLKCKEFKPIGPQQFDKFYCGCNGWD